MSLQGVSLLTNILKCLGRNQLPGAGKVVPKWYVSSPGFPWDRGGEAAASPPKSPQPEPLPAPAALPAADVAQEQGTWWSKKSQPGLRAHSGLLQEHPSAVASTQHIGEAEGCPCGTWSSGLTFQGSADSTACCCFSLNKQCKDQTISIGKGGPGAASPVWFPQFCSSEAQTGSCDTQHPDACSILLGEGWDRWQDTHQCFTAV